MACKDMMAAYVKQLLELDPSSRMSTLDNLSKYADTKEGCSDRDTSVPLRNDVQSLLHKLEDSDNQQSADPILPPGLPIQNGVGGLFTSGLSPDAKAPPGLNLVASLPAKVAVPMRQPQAPAAGIIGAGTVPVPVSANLQQATGALQAAVANWEACLQSEEAAAAAAVPTKQHQLAQQQLLRKQAPTAAEPPMEEKASAFMEKALSDLTTTLPPEVACKVQQLLASAGGSAPEMHPPVATSGAGCIDTTLLQWLTQHLEKQQEASMQKLNKMLGNPAQEAETPGWPLAAGARGGLTAPEQPWAPHSAGRQGRLAAGAAGFQAAAMEGHGPQAWMQQQRLSAGLPAWGAQMSERMLLGQVDIGAPPQFPVPAACLADPVSTRAFVPLGGQQPWWKATYAAAGGAGPFPYSGLEPAAFRGRPSLHVNTAPVATPGRNKGAAKAPAPDPAGKKQVSASVAGKEPAETLRMHLRSLIKVECNRVLIVRKINRLGFASSQVLEDHYSWYGKVERVLVAHSRVKTGAGPGDGGLHSRLRPSGLGFVVMANADDAQAILDMGAEQIVCGAFIRVLQFERRMSTDSDDGDDVEADDVSGEPNSSEESQSPSTAATTATG